MGKFVNGIRYYRENGFSNTISRLIKGPDRARPSEYDLYAELRRRYSREITPLDVASYRAHANDEVMLLNWIIPDPFDGSGGHTTIFRFCSMLENNGFHNRVYCIDSSFSTDLDLDEYAKTHFKVLVDDIEFHCDVSAMAFAHGTIATQWTTAYFLQSFDNTLSKFYFVQDYEPMFYPAGSESVFAEQTYSFGFHAITAGDWLKEMMISKYSLKADSFLFSYDKQIYKPFSRRDSTKRIFFYARPSTPRRNFELGLFVLTELTSRMPEVEVVFAGGDLSQYKIKIPHYKSLGVATPKQLAETYSQCDLCLVFSYTNLSLLPLEIMACGSVVASSQGANNEWLLNDENAILLNNDPKEIVNTLEHYLKDTSALKEKQRGGIACALATDWNQEGTKVAHIIESDIVSAIANIDYRNWSDCEES